MKFKHCFRRVAAAMACLMLCVLSMPGTALAVGYNQLTDAEMSKESRLTLHYVTTNTENPQPLPATEFRLYKVADMNKDVQFTVTEDFAGYPVFTEGQNGYLKINELNQEEWASLANTLSGYVNQDTTEGTLTPARTFTTSAEDGSVTVEGLEVGLYLLVGGQSSVGGTTYTPTPVLLNLPSWTTDSTWNFDVESNLKYTTYTPGGGGGNTITRRVLKVWDDEGNEDARPDSVTVDLLRNGEVYRTATLSAANNWRAEWTGLSAGDVWQVTERIDSEDYTVDVELQGITFTVTNTYAVEIVDPDTPLVEPDNPDGGDPEDPGIDIEDPDVPLEELPQTGQLWWPVPLLAASGLVMIAVGVVRRRNEEL